jgi:superoxide dismutase, Cu-Zn family
MLGIPPPPRSRSPIMRSSALPTLTACLALAACTPGAGDTGRASAPGEPAVEVPAPASTEPASAMAILMPTTGSGVTGALRFAVIDGGVHVTGDLGGLEAGGMHGFHVHEIGDCSAVDGSSAGGHFNPDDSPHGRVGGASHHVGDTDNLMADTQGLARADHRLAGATLGDGAPTDVVGRAVIVHAGTDDYASQPTGDAGARLACGVIEAAP